MAKGKGQGSNFRQAQDANTADNLARDPLAVSGRGADNPRVAAAKNKIKSLTRAGVRINPNTATTFTKGLMDEAASPAGRLNKLFR